MVPMPGSVPPNVYNPPRPPEVYTLSDATDEVFSGALRGQFQRDDAGRILFFTAPPLDRAQSRISDLGHSAKFIQGRQEWFAEREKKRKARDEASVHAHPNKAALQEGYDPATGASVADQATDALGKWFQDFDKDTVKWLSEAGLEGWDRRTRV